MFEFGAATSKDTGSGKPTKPGSATEVIVVVVLALLTTVSPLRLPLHSALHPYGAWLHSVRCRKRAYRRTCPRTFAVASNCALSMASRT